MPVENDGTGLDNERSDEPQHECEGPCAAAQCEERLDDAGERVSEDQGAAQVASEDEVEVVRDEEPGEI